MSKRSWSFLKFLAMAVLVLSICACREESADVVPADKETIVKKVAVVLPMEQGLDVHWRRCLDLYTANIERAYKSQDVMVRLDFELYDEQSADLEELCDELGRRDDIYAVVGGLYSSNAAEMVARLARVGKSFFTLATAEELVRGYASTGYLWAMTETDITQCEVLLSKVVNYGGQSVALVAGEGSIYAKTFIDWFAFQAKELGLENRGTFSYSPGGEAPAMERALAAAPDYVICVPSEISEIGPLVEAQEVYVSTNQSPSRLLFSDTAYGKDVLNMLGTVAEGIEGVSFGADPESGFDVSYRTFFGELPTTGEAQLYDSLMLLGYAAWYQCLHEGTSLQSALREIVSGEDINMGSWTGEDMSLVIDALARGDSPFIRGASGPLRFDKKIFTNVLATTYYSYKIYDGQYIILDYNTSDGGKRTDATLAGWNWKASQMQDFDEGDGTLSYAPHTGNYALLIAASTGWTNYRHQADVLAIYGLLKRGGYDDDHIILIAEDDLALNELNPDKGTVRVTPGGANVHAGAQIDYRLSQLEPADFVAILKGASSSRLPKVIDSDEGDNIFIFWSGHGEPGRMLWDEHGKGMTAAQLREAFDFMHRENRYRKLLMMVEACYSGSVMQQCEGIPGLLYITAANPDETSKADIFNGELGVWMSNRFTSTFIEQITLNPSISMRDLYYRLFLNTVGSHVMVYNAPLFSPLYSSSLPEFLLP